jgi:uncharacterized protein
MNYDPNSTNSDASLPAAAPTPTERTFKPGFFTNSRGIRSGWRLLLYLLIAAAISVPIVIVGGIVIKLALGKHSPYIMFANGAIEGGIAGAMMLAGYIVCRFIEKRPYDSLGLPLRLQGIKELAIGMVVGFGLISLTMLLLVVTHAYAFHGANEGLADALKYGVLMGFGFTCVGLFEEIFFRGYLLQNLADGVGIKWAIFISSFVFAAVHAGNPGENIVGLIDVFAAAILLMACILKTKSMWLAIGVHMAWDWGQSFFYGVADSGTRIPGYLLKSQPHGPSWLSGGTVGPEGSIFAVIVCLLGAVWIYRARWIEADSRNSELWRRFVFPGWRGSDARPLEGEGRNV